MLMTRVSLFGVAVLAAAVCTSACSSGPEAGGPAGAAAGGRGGGRGGAAAAVPIATGVAYQKAVAREIRIIGTAEASTIVAVRAQVTGELTKVTFKEGDEVAKGEVLFELDRRPLAAALQQARANLQRDIATADNARASAARYQDLQTRGIATREQSDQARTSADALAAAVDADKAAVDNAQVQLDYATIHAPSAGRTGQLMVHVGNLVRANDTTPLVTINAISPINVSFGVPEAQLPELKRYLAKGGVRVSAVAPNEEGPSAGRIDFIDNAVDQTTGQIKVKGSFPNTDRRLWPGQFVNVTVTLTTDPAALVVPSVAVQNGQQGPYVYVVKADKTVEFRPVSVDREMNDETVIKSGLKAGEVVVTDGHLRLVAGSKVTIKSAADTATAAGSKTEP